MRKAIVLLVGLSLVSAGCLGFGEESDGDLLEPTGEPGDDGDGSNDTAGNDTGSNETRGNRSSGNETGDNRTAGNETQGNQTGENHTDDGGQGNHTRWTYDNRTGTVSGTNAVATEASATETFNVTADTRELQLDLTAEGGELDVCIQSAEGGNESGEDSECTAEESTEDGNLTWSKPSPTVGEWSLEMTAQGIGPQSVDYELVIAQLVPADPSGNETSGNETDDPYP